MPKSISDSKSPLIDNATPTDALVTSFLERTDDTDKGRQFILDQWAKIQVDQPSIARFINVNAYRTAPNDPETREIISSSMVQLFLILSEASLQKDVSDKFADSLSIYFPVKS